MRKLLSLILALPLLAQAAHVQFFPNDASLAGIVTNRQIIVTPITNLISGVYIISGDSIKTNQGTNVSVTISNLVYGDYQVEFVSKSAKTSFTILVPETNALLNATGLVTSVVSVPGANAGYTQSTIDGLLSQLTEWATMSRNYLYVSTNGDDATAARGRPDRPWLTIAAAVTNAIAGDTIGVYPGEYLAEDALRNMVGIWTEPGVTFTNSGEQASANKEMFHDRLRGATTNLIAGKGIYKMPMSSNTFVNGALQHGILVTTNPATMISFEGERMEIECYLRIGADGVAAVNVRNCYRVNVKLNEILDTGVGKVTLDPQDPETEIFSGCSGVFWGVGDLDVEVRRNVMEGGYCVWGDRWKAATNDLWYKGSLTRSVRHSPIYLSGSAGGSSPTYRMWVDVPYVYADTTVGITVIGGGKLYFTKGEKVFGKLNALDITEGWSWIDSQKFGHGPGAGSLFMIQSGENRIRGMHYEQEGQSDVAMINIRGGTNVIEGGVLVVTNQVGVKLSGRHSTRLKDVTIQTVGITTHTLTLTSLPLGGAGTNVTWNGVTREWTNSSTATTILTNLTSIAHAATNMFDAFTAYPSADGIRLEWSSPTSFIFRSVGGTLSASGGWCSIVTNTPGDTYWPVMNLTNGLVFQNASLEAATGSKAYWNSNANNSATVRGILSLNTSTNSEARFIGGIVVSGDTTKFFP